MNYKKNDYINHARFGIGRIVRIVNDKPRMMVVDFDGDERNFVLGRKLDSQILPMPEESGNTNEETAIENSKSLTKKQRKKKTNVSKNDGIILDSNNPVSYKTIFEAINSSIGKELTFWRGSCWPSKKGNGNFRMWFPQLASIKQGKLVAATNNCVNTLSNDWDTLIYDNLRDTDDEIKFKDVKNLIFAREPKNGAYIFRGVYLLDKKESANKHHVYRRIGKKVRMIGHPAYNFMIIDDEPIPEEEPSIPSTLEKPIISFACAKTYDLVNETHVHAHPLANNYPSTIYPYVMVRAKGGKSRYIFKVIDHVDLDPKDSNQIVALPGKYDSVKVYFNNRIKKSGFGKIDVPYRFYLLEPIYEFNPVLVLNQNVENYKLFSFEELGARKPKAQDAATMKKRLVDSINEYVQRNGTDEIKSASEILRIASLSNRAGNILPSDYCYNRYNKGLKGFEGPFLFEYLGTNKYKLLGENYPYSGLIAHKPRGKAEQIIGKWTDGFVDITDEGTDWKEYKRKQDKLEKEQIKAEVEALEEDLNNLNLKGTDRLAVVKARVNQGVFRSRLLRKYGKCCLCGFDDPVLLLASHIKTWSESNPDERTDVNNGLLLCPNHDKLFDKNYISFDGEGNILISSELSKSNQVLMNINSSMKIDLSEKMKIYMDHHRKKLLS